MTNLLDNALLEKGLFFLFGGLAVIFSALMMSRKNPLSAALCLVVTLLSLAGLYAMLGAAFVALLQVLVYAGAIMMLIIFVIMTVNLGPSDLADEKPVLAGSLVAGVLLVFTLGRLTRSLLREPLSFAPEGFPGTIENLGRVLFTRHVLSFEIISVLLLVALVGVAVLTQKKGGN